MELFVTLFPWIVGIFGLIVGSFLNVVVLRWGEHMDLGGRSHCPNCKKQLAWYELFPVISFVLQGGKCRGCRTLISGMYPAGELATGVLFFLGAQYVLYLHGFSVMMVAPLVLLLIVNSLIVMITVYDIRTKTIPVIWIIGLFVFGIGFLVAHYASSIHSMSFFELLITHGTGVVIAVPFLFLWLISRGRWMGFGDIELLAWMGMMLGITWGLLSLFIAIYIGGLFGLGYIAVHMARGMTYAQIRKQAIAFGPFLLLGFLVVWYGSPWLYAVVNFFL